MLHHLVLLRSVCAFSPRPLSPRNPHRARATSAALAPSGVDGLPFAVQQAEFAATFAALGASATGIDAAYKNVQRARPKWAWDAWELGAALLLGVIFMTAGRSHFTIPAAFIAIYPPAGTWGFWHLPGSPEFHVAWTGVAELCGGAGLALSGIIDASALIGARPNDVAASGGLRSFSARALFLLVLAVTPANFLMYSHGAVMPGIVEGPLSMPWHVARFVAQVSVLSVLLTLSERDRRPAGPDSDDADVQWR